MTPMHHEGCTRRRPTTDFVKCTYLDDVHMNGATNRGDRAHERDDKVGHEVNIGCLSEQDTPE